MSINDFKPICMTEEYWANTQLNAVRYFGRIKIGQHAYVIVNREGKDVFECSLEADRAGREKAIEPGEPADLCRQDFVKYYRRLGRDRFLQVLELHRQDDDKVVEQAMKEAAKEVKTSERRIRSSAETQLTLF